ncbi:MAG: hypothetical protein ABFS03_00970 [Chloroflexota bacterium]
MPGSVVVTDENGRSLSTTDSSGNPAGNVSVADPIDLSYGGYPEDRYDQSAATAGDALDNTTFGELTDQDIYEGIVFMNTTANVSVQISLDGTTWIAADHPFIDMGVATRTIVTGTAAATGPYLMNTPCRGVRFLNEGAAQATVMYSQVGKVGI